MDLVGSFSIPAEGQIAGWPKTAGDAAQHMIGKYGPSSVLILRKESLSEPCRDVLMKLVAETFTKDVAKLSCCA